MKLLQSISDKIIWQTSAGNTALTSFFSADNLLEILVVLLYFILLVMLVVLVIWFVQKIYTSQKNISIFPWINETGDKAYDGFSMGIDDLVMKNLQDIQNQDQSIAPQIEPIRDIIPDENQNRQESKFRVQMGNVARYQTGNIQGGQMGNVQTMGKLSLGPIEIPVGFLLSYITRALGGKYIKGYIQKYGTVLKVAIQIETRPSLANLLTIKWFKKRAAKKRFQPRYGTRYIELNIDEDSIASTIEELSYAIYYELGESTLPQNWQTYRHFLKGKKAYRDYLDRSDHEEFLETAEGEMLKVVQNDSSFVDGQYLMGLIAIDYRRTDSALLRFNQVIDALNSVEEINDYQQEILLQSYMNVAIIYQHFYNDPNRAFQMIDSALQSLKDCPLSLYLSKADILINSNRVEEARNLLDDYPVKPKNDQEKLWLYETKAQVHFQLRQYEETLSLSNKILEIDPDNLTVRFHRAYINAQSEDLAGAEKDYRALLLYSSKEEHLLYNYIWYSLKANNMLELQAVINRYESLFMGTANFDIYKQDFFNPFIAAISVRESEKQALIKLAGIVANQKLSNEDVWKKLIATDASVERELFLFYALGVFSRSKIPLSELKEKLPDISVIFNPPDFSHYYFGFALHYVYIRWLMSELRIDAKNFSQFMEASLPQNVEPLDFIRKELVKLLSNLLKTERGFISQFNLLDVYDLIFEYYSLIPKGQDYVDALYEERIEVLEQKIYILNELGLKNDASNIYVQIAEELENWSRYKHTEISYFRNLIAQAHQALDKAFTLNLQNHEILGRRSLLYYDQANDIEAIRAGEQALERKYNQDWVHYNLGMSYKYVQEYDEAEAHFRYAIQFKRRGWDPETIGWDPYIKLADLYKAQKKYEQAIKLLQSARRHHPRHHTYSHYLAEFYSLNEQYEEGLNLLDRINLKNFNVKHLPEYLKLAEWGMENNRKFNVVAAIANSSMGIYSKKGLDSQQELKDTFMLSRINLLLGWSMYFQSDLEGAMEKAQQAQQYLPDHPYMLALKALIFEKKARFNQNPEEQEAFIADSLEYWKDLYLLTDKHKFKERAENTLKYYGKLAAEN